MGTRLVQLTGVSFGAGVTVPSCSEARATAREPRTPAKEKLVRMGVERSDRKWNRATPMAGTQFLLHSRPVFLSLPVLVSSIYCWLNTYCVCLITLGWLSTYFVPIFEGLFVPLR